MNPSSEPAAQTQPTTLAQQVRSGLAWSFLGSIALRVGNLAVSITLARLLTPEIFGVFAVALSVQTILLSITDLGMETYLVRVKDPEARAPTVATISLISGVVLAAAVFASAGIVADGFDAPQSAPVIELLSITLIIAAVDIVPYARLIRDIKQRLIFRITVSTFTVQSAVSIVLVVLDHGPIALAIGMLAGQSVGVVMSFVLTRTRPRFGFHRGYAGPALRFGIPAALAAMLAIALINVDNLVVARIMGDHSLGLYVLAFSIASWPMSAIGYTIQPVALAAFARNPHPRASERPGGRDPALAIWAAFAWAAAVPAAMLLIALAQPVVRLLYGETWIEAAPAVAALAALGASRVLLDLMDKYLLAHGASRTVLWIHVVWITALIPALAFGTGEFGLPGAGLASLAIAFLVVMPGYLRSVYNEGADVRAVLAAIWPPVVAAIPAGFAAFGVARSVDPPLLSVGLGTAVGLSIYAGLLFRWFARLLRSSKSHERAAPSKQLKQS